MIMSVRNILNHSQLSVFQEAQIFLNSVEKQFQTCPIYCNHNHHEALFTNKTHSYFRLTAVNRNPVIRHLRSFGFMEFYGNIVCKLSVSWVVLDSC